MGSNDRTKYCFDQTELREKTRIAFSKQEFDESINGEGYFINSN